MKIHLPNGAFLGNIDQFLAGFDPANSEKLDITAVDRWMWLHPMVLSMVASLAIKIDSKKISCQKITARSGHYLERMGLFRFLGIESGMEIIEHDPSGRFVPLTQIKNSTELTKFITDMVPMLHLEPKQVDPIRYTISELVRNVIEHAEAKNGAMVCAQYFKKSNTIRIGIAYTNRDFFVVYSGDGMYKLLKRKENDELMLRANPDLDRHSEKKNLPNWNGTAIGIDISLDSTGQFNALLDLIRGTYSKAVRERRKERYREPKFI